ncbi:MAG: substrate-binding domain-containing protein [Promethearchaeota archaeon]
MEKKGIITLAIIGILAAAFITWSAVGVFYGEEILEEDKEQKDINIFISGSTTCFPIIVKCAAEFEEENTEYNFAVSGGGSSVGISNVINDISNLGMASRPLKQSEKDLEPRLRQKAIANDGIALIMSAGNTHFSSGLIPQWTLEDVLKCWNGTYSVWSDAPGCTGSESIILIGRDSNSGTRASFEEITGLEDDPAYQSISKQELNSNGAVHDAVAGDEDGIGYVGLGYVDSAVDTIDLYNDGPSGPGYYQATVENVKSGDYLISRQLYIIYKAPLDSDYDKFIQWVRTDGQSIVAEEGFVTL